jgi:hypothetical protein
MITNLKKQTQRPAQEFSNGMKAFRNLLSKKTPEELVVTPLQKLLDKKDGLLHLFSIEQKNPVKGSRKVTLAINTEGGVRCYFFGENKSGHEGTEYDEVGEYELQKSHLRHAFQLKKWRYPNDFVLIHPKLIDWINSGN